MKIKLPKEYSGRQILDAYKAALLMFNCGGKVWTVEEQSGSIFWEFGSDGKPIKAKLAVKAVASLSMEKTGRNDWKKRKMKLSLGAMREDVQYGEIEICAQNISPKAESRRFDTRTENGLFFYVFLQQLKKKLEAPVLAAAA